MHKFELDAVVIRFLACSLVFTALLCIDSCSERYLASIQKQALMDYKEGGHS